jgi:hypothetical protein
MADGRSRSALDMAREKGHQEIMELLEKYTKGKGKGKAK